MSDLHMSNSEIGKIRREIIDSKIEKSRLQGSGHGKFKADLEKRLKLLEDKELERQENRKIKRKRRLEKDH